MQEGWHLELDDPSEPLTYKGVVFNEMKGVYSSPDSMFYRTVQQVMAATSSSCWHTQALQFLSLQQLSSLNWFPV